MNYLLRKLGRINAGQVEILLENIHQFCSLNKDKPRKAVGKRRFLFIFKRLYCSLIFKT